MTASAMRGERERCLAAGMDDYIAKPVRIEDLECVLRRVLATPGAGVTAELETRGNDRPDPNRPIDRARLARLLPLNRPGHENALADLIGEFLADAPLRLGALREAAAQHDRTAMNETAHALRGAADHFGALEIVALCEQLERLARTSNLGGAIELIEALEEALATSWPPSNSARSRLFASPRWPSANASPGAKPGPSSATTTVNTFLSRTSARTLTGAPWPWRVALDRASSRVRNRTILVASGA
jgi:HPt (histidine-containing phosphotransfer) domain-containing protein